MRRDIEKERYGRVRPAAMVFFINLIDGSHHDGWWLLVGGWWLISSYPVVGVDLVSSL